MVLIIME